jgi:uncharacterized protein DUF6069
MTTLTPATPLTTARPRTAALALTAAVAVAIAACGVIAAAAVAAGATAFSPLLPFVFGPFAAAGVLAAYAGWRIVRRVARRPRAVLRVLVPVLLVLSFIPDIVLLITGFIPGTTTTGAVALMLMHLTVAGVAVPVAQRLAPV